MRKRKMWFVFFLFLVLENLCAAKTITFKELMSFGRDLIGKTVSLEANFYKISQSEVTSLPWVKIPGSDSPEGMTHYYSQTAADEWIGIHIADSKLSDGIFYYGFAEKEKFKNVVLTLESEDPVQITGRVFDMKESGEVGLMIENIRKPPPVENVGGWMKINSFESWQSIRESLNKKYVFFDAMILGGGQCNLPQNKGLAYLDLANLDKAGVINKLGDVSVVMQSSLYTDTQINEWATVPGYGQKLLKIYGYVEGGPVTCGDKICIEKRIHITKIVSQ